MASGKLSHRVAIMRRMFLFVNPKSGGNMASAYIHEVPDQELESDGVHLKVYNIFDGSTGQKEGMLDVKKYLEDNSDAEAIVVAAGGDGTVMWIISELLATGCCIERICVGVIPFGTGNDFSRSIGWGKKPPPRLVGHDCEDLKAAMRSWMKAEVTPFDLWEVETTTFENGGFLFPDGKDKVCKESHMKQHNIQEVEGGGWKMVKPMLNYFGFGHSERAGLGVEKGRTKSRFMNNMLYTTEGMKKLAFSHAPLVSDVMETISVGELDKDPLVISTDHKCNAVGQARFTDKRISELIFLNVPSWGGGALPWEWSRNLGIAGEADSRYAANGLENVGASVGDGKIEVLSWSSRFGLSVNIANSKFWTPGRGRSRRVHQGKGPYTLDFKGKDQAIYKKEGRVYAQIDGEFYVMTRPKQVVIRHKQTIRVLTCRGEPYGKSRGCCGA